MLNAFYVSFLGVFQTIFFEKQIRKALRFLCLHKEFIKKVKISNGYPFNKIMLNCAKCSYVGHQFYILSKIAILFLNDLVSKNNYCNHLAINVVEI